jgi:hypothetical protein
MLVLKPKGRGNWRTVVMSVEGDRAQPLLVKVGDSVTLAGIVFRICKVIP